MSRPVHFEIQASDPQTLTQFYSTLFGWQFERWGEAEYWMIQTGDGPGINGGLLPRQQERPAPGQSVNASVLTMPVDDCDATVASAVAMGATVALPASDMPGVGRLAYLLDPDGNLFGVLKGEM